MDPLVSIIIPAYNHYSYLQERLESIFGQSYQNFEVIILDDASSDNSLDLLETYSDHKKISHFIVNQNNSGSPFKQWKKGLELARGNFIWIAESDDSCSLNFLETQLNCIGDAAASVARTLIFDAMGVRGEINHPVFRDRLDPVLGNKDIFHCPVLNISAMIFKTDVLKYLSEAHFSNFRIIGDRVFYFEFFQHKKIVFCGETEAYYRQEGNALSNLDSKDLSYFQGYFYEHTRFISLAARKEKGALDKMRIPYLRRFFNRVKNRLPRRRKMSVRFAGLYIYYLWQVLKIKLKS